VTFEVVSFSILIEAARKGMKDELVEILKSRSAGPFLFVGSGFARRYVGLEDWKGLLSKFCVTGKPFEYYLASANGRYPEIASLLAKDFNEYWWEAPEYAESVAKDKSKVTGVTSALRIEICRYLTTLDQAKAKASIYADEVKLLAGLNVDGVITTNWDLLLEQIFPDYKVYVGQEELLFSNPQQIGEIYKIHGCATVPESLVLTAEDYKQFHDRNAYLASKLITIFVEHPIIFIGYSLSDSNISSLLRAISTCIGENNIEQLRKNLIFVQRLAKGEVESISDTYLTIDGVQIPLVLMKTDDLRPVYEALGAVKRKIPARILRYCKEQLYELVNSAEPEKKLCVIDYDEIDKKEEVEFLVGVGVSSFAASTISDIGYAPIEVLDLISDVLHEDKNYDPDQIVTNVIKIVGRNTKNVPVFKYLREIGISSNDDYQSSGLKLDKWVMRDIKDFRIKSCGLPFFKRRHLSLDELIEACTAENASMYIPWVTPDKIDLEVLHIFLVDNEDKMHTSPYASHFKKLVVLYDKLKWGWKN
jgi:hypothetical protein